MEPNLNKRLIARLDIKKNKLIKGVHLEGLRYIGNPKEYALKYYEEGIDELLLLDSVASLHGRNALHDIIDQITQNIFIPITIGGGINSLDQAKKMFDAGADKITLNTYALENPNLITEIASKTNNPPATNNINSFFVITLIAPIAAPADNEPVSPINIFAGGALNHKKPNPAPIKAAQNTAISPAPVI